MLRIYLVHTTHVSSQLSFVGRARQWTTLSFHSVEQGSIQVRMTSGDDFRFTRLKQMKSFRWWCRDVMFSHARYPRYSIVHPVGHSSPWLESWSGWIWWMPDTRHTVHHCHAWISLQCSFSKTRIQSCWIRTRLRKQNLRSAVHRCGSPTVDFPVDRGNYRHRLSELWPLPPA